MSDSMTTYTTTYAACQRFCVYARFARALTFRLAEHLHDGEIVVIEDGRMERFRGKVNPLNLRATIQVHDARFYKRFITGGSIGAGEAYMEGWWSCDDVCTLVRILSRNAALYAELDKGWMRLAKPLHTAWHWLRANTPRNSRKNIAAHYDLGNDFFSLFLDYTMAYSAAVFPRQDAPLDEASEAKFERICRKLELKPEDHLLEIGTGWGGLAVHAALSYGCRVTTTTISREQYEGALERVRYAGVQDRVTVLLQDYRDLDGQYDKLVSIEMVEAVGWEYLPQYFQKCASLLKADGRMVLQGITTSDQDFERVKREPDFIKRYIFPGGSLPSTTSMMQAVSAKTDFRLVHYEDIAPHYALTLLHWREAFRENLSEVRSQGFDERFIRMWDFYLGLCAGAFAERRIGSVQMVLGKPLCRPGAMNLPALAAVEIAA